MRPIEGFSKTSRPRSRRSEREQEEARRACAFRLSNVAPVKSLIRGGASRKDLRGRLDCVGSLRSNPDSPYRGGRLTASLRGSLTRRRSRASPREGIGSRPGLISKRAGCADYDAKGLPALYAICGICDRPGTRDARGDSPLAPGEDLLREPTSRGIRRVSVSTRRRASSNRQRVREAQRKAHALPDPRRVRKWSGSAEPCRHKQRRASTGLGSGSAAKRQKSRFGVAGCTCARASGCNK